MPYLSEPPIHNTGHPDEKSLWEKYEKNIVVQQYIQNPLLLKHKFKFDFWVYMMPARSNPCVAYFSDGYIQRAYSPDPYHEGGNLAHITDSYATEEKT